MLRHNHVSENNQPVASANSLESREKKIAANRFVEERLPLVAAERHEMKIASAVEALRMVRHRQTVQGSLERCL